MSKGLETMRAKTFCWKKNYASTVLISKYSSIKCRHHPWKPGGQRDNHNHVHIYRVTNYLLSLHHFCSLTCHFNTFTHDPLFTEILDQARWYLASTMWHYYCVYFTHKTVIAPIASTQRWNLKLVNLVNCSWRLVVFEDGNGSDESPLPERKQCQVICKFSVKTRNSFSMGVCKW